MERWKRVGLDAAAIPVLVRSAHDMLPDRENRSPDLYQHGCRSSDVSRYRGAAILWHFEAAGLPDESGLFPAKRGAQIAVDYFFGSWRDHFANPSVRGEHFDAAMCRKHLEWFETYREGLFCACAVEDGESLNALLKWPDVDLHHDGGAWDVAKEENDFHILLALTMRNDKPEEQAKLRRRISAGRAVRPKLCLAGLDAILQADPRALMAALDQLLKYNLKREFRPDHPYRALMVEGTILWHFARMKGMDLPDLPQPLEDRIVTRESLSAKAS